MSEPLTYDAPHRTETQRLGDDIKQAMTNLRRDWPHMIRPGDKQPPGFAMKTGAPQGARDGEIDDMGRLRFPKDQSPEVGQKGEATDSDQRRIDKVISLRVFAVDLLNSWCRVVCEDMPTQPIRKCSHGAPVVTLQWPRVGPTFSTCPAGRPWFVDDEWVTHRGVHSVDGTSADDMATLIERHAEWLSGHEAAQDARDELVDLAHRCHSIAFPTRRESISIGRCPLEVPGEQDVLAVCGGDVRVRPEPDQRPGEAYAACNQCGEVAVASWWAERMFVDGEGSPLVTAGELVAVIAYRLEIVVTHDQIRQWKHRGKITAEGADNKGRTLYRHEDVIAAIRSDLRAKAARRLDA